MKTRTKMNITAILSILLFVAASSIGEHNHNAIGIVVLTIAVALLGISLVFMTRLSQEYRTK